MCLRAAPHTLTTCTLTSVCVTSVVPPDRNFPEQRIAQLVEHLTVDLMQLSDGPWFDSGWPDFCAWADGYARK